MISAAQIRLALFVSPFSISLTGQVTTASILGTVTDRTGAVVPNAQVTATNIDTDISRMVSTDAAGQYSIRFLPVGAYRLEATAPGFKKFEQSGIVLELSRNVRLDPVLDLGTLTETVSVSADAPMDRFDPAAKRVLDEYIPKEYNYEGGRYLIQQARPLNTGHFLFKLDDTARADLQSAGVMVGRPRPASPSSKTRCEL